MQHNYKTQTGSYQLSSQQTYTTGSYRSVKPKKKRSGALLFTVASVLVASVAGYLVSQTIQNAAPLASRPIVKVLVATHDIPLGKAISAEDVMLVDWPEENAPFRVSSVPDDVLGRVVMRPLVQGETISSQRLAPLEAGQGLGALIPRGMRAQALRVNEESGVAGFIQPGDFVDVVMILRGPDGLSSKTSLQNTQVIAVGEHYQQGVERDGGATKTPVVTVLIRPEDANLLAIAATNGQIVLTLRNGYDTEVIATVGFSGETARLAAAEEPEPVAPTTDRKKPKDQTTKATPKTSQPEEPPAPAVDAPGLPQVIIGGKVVKSGAGDKKPGKTILVPMR